MLFATLPSPHEESTINKIVYHDTVGAVRFNTGVASPWSPYETLERLLEKTNASDIPLWIDLKGRQLRIAQWSSPKDGGEIILNHAIDVDLPAQIIFRGEHGTTIREIRGNRIYVDPQPRYTIGAGQSVNIIGQNLEISGYLTEQDKAYIHAACQLGINRFMLSFVESAEDAQELLDIIKQCGFDHVLPDTEIVLKIESQKGIAYVDSLATTKMPKNQRLMAARDDLLQQVGHNKSLVLPTIKKIVTVDPQAICASRILTSVEKGNGGLLGDLADIALMKHFGYKHFMLCDDICRKHFSEAIALWMECSNIRIP